MSGTPIPLASRSSVGLYVMNEKGLAVLTAAIESDIEIAHVTYAPAQGMADDSHTTIAELAKRHGIPTFLRAHPPQFAAGHSVAAGWRWMLEVPDLVVLHDSLLPRYRGFAPLVTALVNGEPQIGVSAFLAEAEPDTGPVVAQRSIPIVYPARARAVLDRIVPLYHEIAAAIFATLAAGEPIRAAQQDHAKATWSLWRDEHDYRIDWSADDRRVVRLVDAVSDPFPGAWTTVGGERVGVLEAESVPDRRIEDRVPGKVAYLDGGRPVVVCGSGLVRLPAVAVPLKTRFA